MNYEDKREDLDFTSAADMTLSFLSEVRLKMLDAIEDHLDEYEVEDWGFYSKSNCYRTIAELLQDEGVTEKYYDKLVVEAEKCFDTEVTFRLGILAQVAEEKK